MQKIFLALISAVCVLSCNKNEKQEGNDTSQNIENTEKIPTLISNATTIELGMALVKGSDCMSCHKTEERLIGPSYRDIAAKYTQKDIKYLADKIINGGSGVWGSIPMQAHPGISQEDAQRMAIYVLSVK